jgi:glycosyltransferase involved in cell wall biosynthesis
MKILLLGDGGSSHVQKWVLSLSNRGFEIGLFSLHHFDEQLYKNCNAVILNNPPLQNVQSTFSKLGYLSQQKLLRQQLDKFKPDILHAHYASSYGLLGARSGFHPFIVSVWGSDVYDFPRTSPFHNYFFKKVLSAADVICSTSHCMKKETEKYTRKKIEVIPFGIDISTFSPIETKSLQKDSITIGNIKSLEENYGISTLIEAFAQAVKQHPDKKLRLLLVGDGSQKENYKQLCSKHGIQELVEFTGRVPHTDIVSYHRKIDIFACLSYKESFGVSLVEAMACGTPVVASDAEGFVEIIEDKHYGLIVPKKSATGAAEAISYYINHPDEAAKKASEALSHVREKYDWNKNVEQMISVYQSTGSKR